MTSGAIDRTAGLEEIIDDDAAYRMRKVNGRWTSEGAEAAVHEWLGNALLDPRFCLDLICSQSEMMLPGIRVALARRAKEVGRPDLTRVPQTVCDGLPAYKREVSGGLLTATVEVPPRVPPAVQILAEFWKTGRLPPEPEVVLIPSSYPALGVLKRTQARKGGSSTRS